MHLSVDSRKPLEDLRRDLLLACAREGLRVEGAAGIVSPAASKSFAVELSDPLPELRVATPGSADGRTWRISGYRGEAGLSRVSTIRPTLLLDLLGHPELRGPALVFEQRLERALKDAAGWEDARSTPP